MSNGTDLPRRVLGFDVRTRLEKRTVPKDAAGGPPGLEIQLAAEFPLSIDRAVWPSVFSFSPIDLEYQAAGLTMKIPAYECEGHFWNDLCEMLRRLTAEGAEGVPIAVELFAPRETDVHEFPSPLIYTRATPSEVSFGAIALGYDVADAGFHSCIGSMKYSEYERYLNTHGLISDESLALEFRSISKTRLRDTSLLWVFKLYALLEGALARASFNSLPAGGKAAGCRSGSA